MKQTKRTGFWDIEGVVKISFENNNLLVLDSHEDCDASYKIEVILLVHMCTIDEPKAKVTFNDGCTVDGFIPPQSQLTGVLLNDLIARSACICRVLELAHAQSVIYLGIFFSF